MADNGRGSTMDGFAQSLLARVVVYYVLLAGIVVGSWQLMSPGMRDVVRDALASLVAFEAITALPGALGAGTVPPSEAVPPSHPLVLVVVAVLSAFLLALPVAWVFMFTRQRKGYRASDVQALVLIPVVVAGVVILVKNSLALAFSLAGIVAAVRFRTNLEDSRDATFIFLAMALGIACGVQIEVAAVLSMLFNGVVLALWYTDFARMPPALEGARAQRQLERAMAIANRTSQFVARLDQEVLEALAPAQLDALEERLRQRRAELSGELPGIRSKFDARMRVLTSDPIALRSVVDPVLEAEVKRWRCRGSTVADGGAAAVEYDIRLRKGQSRQSLMEAVRARGAPHVEGLEVVETETE